MNQFKRLFVLVLLVIFVLGAASCSPQTTVYEGGLPTSSYRISQFAAYHVGIATISYAQAEDEMRGAEALVQDFGNAQYGGTIKHIVFPDNFAQEQAATISDIVGLADDPLMKAIIVNPAVGGTAEAFRIIREKRDDILLIAGGPQDDPISIAGAADIVVDQDFISRGYYDIVRAKQMGATTFVHMSFPRHMAIDQLYRRREIYESVCDDLGILFVSVTVPDPAGEVGVSGAQQAVYDMIPQLVEQYGKDTVFFTTNTAQHEPVLKRVMEYGAIFVASDDASPLVGYPAALNLELREEPEEWSKIVSRIEQAVVEKGMGGRMGIFACSLTYCHSRALGRLAVDILEGRSTGDIMADITNAYQSLTPECEWYSGHYREESSGREIENFYTLSQDIYVLGQGYSGVMSEPIPQKNTSIYLVIGVAALVVFSVAVLFFYRRKAVPQAEPLPAPDLSNLHLTAREMEVLSLLASGLSTAQIAQDLFISEKTVRVHISNMIAKTDSDSRTSLILLAKREIAGASEESEANI